MVILIAGGTHTGKTVLAQRLLEKHHYPYLSVDHLKMGLIRSGYCTLTPENSQAELTQYLWPIVREMVKTAIENKQNMIVEGSYIPFDFQADFTPEYLREIRYVCLVFSENYIRTQYADILRHASDVEHRIGAAPVPMDTLLNENRSNLMRCQEHKLRYILVESSGDIPRDLAL